MDTISSTEDENDIFRFWDLPRELRDEIYDLSSERVAVKCNDNIQLHAIDVPALSLLLISKQFKHEYETRMKKKVRQLLVAADFSVLKIPKRMMVTLSKPMLDIRTVHINLTISLAAYLKIHHDWIREVADSFGSRCAINICIDVPLYNEFDEEAPDPVFALDLINTLHDTYFNQDRVWFNLNNLAELRIYDCSRREECSLTEIRRPGDRDRLMMEWTATERVLKDYTDSQ